MEREELQCIDKEILDKIIKCSNKHNKKTVGNAITYSENIKAYYEYLKLVCYFIKVLSLSGNSFSASLILKKLTDIGTFSKNGSFIRQNTANDITGFWGLNVIEGSGVCRHVSAFQSDVLTRINMLSDVLYVNTGKLISDDKVVKADHAINIIKYKDVIYGFEATTGALFCLETPSSLKEMFRDKPRRLIYSPCTDMAVKGETLKQVSEKMNTFEKMICKETISKEEYDYIVQLANRAITVNESLIDDFKEASKKHIKKIVRK